MLKDAKMIPLGVASPFTTGATPSTKESRFYGEGHLWANISDLGPKMLTATSKSITPAGLTSASFGAMAEPGDLLFSFKLSVGTVSIAAAPMYTNEAIATFKASKMLSPRYAYYMLPEYLLRAANHNIYGAPLLNDGIMQRTKVPVPPLATQHLIADYLDGETAEIDAMIAKMDELAETLKARRAAAISAQLLEHQGMACALGLMYSFHNGDRGASYPSRDEFATSGIPHY